MSESEKLTSNSSHGLARLRSLLDGRLGDAEGRLPTERELAQQLGMGRRATRCALEVLEAEGCWHCRKACWPSSPRETADEL